MYSLTFTKPKRTFLVHCEENESTKKEFQFVNNVIVQSVKILEILPFEIIISRRKGDVPQQKELQGQGDGAGHYIFIRKTERVVHQIVQEFHLTKVQ